jgi:hypothetical protein
MPWLSQESYPLPEEDLVSFAFGNTDYDDDKPVGVRSLRFEAALIHCRSIMMQRMSLGAYHEKKA